MIYRYEGREQFEEYLDAVRAVEYGTASPGAAKAILRCSRQYIDQLVRRPDIRAWGYYERVGGLGRWRLNHMEISGDDLIRYAIRVQGWSPSEHMEYIHPRAVKIYEQEFAKTA